MEINPTWQEAFRSELANNMKRRSNNFTIQLKMIDVTIECVWYSCDMCLHYYRTGAFKGFFPSTIDKITYNVCKAMESMVPEFGDDQTDEIMEKVHKLLEDPDTYDILQQHIDDYYCR